LLPVWAAIGALAALAAHLTIVVERVEKEKAPEKAPEKETPEPLMISGMFNP